VIGVKSNVIPSEADPFVHERINAVEGPAVRRRNGPVLHAADSLQKKAGSSTRRWIGKANPSPWSE
jgi:hypothetical protein